MPTKVKSTENMSKHLTREELAARTEAEAEVRPKRETVRLEPPKWLGKKTSKARKLWNSVLARMEGLDILDDLDAEMLAVYCRNVELRTTLQERLDAALAAEALPGKETLAIAKQISTIDGHIAGYAERLGLTPSGRARLAMKRAEAAEEDPDGDLFG